MNVLQVGSFLGLAALGETVVILLGGIDLSTGGVVSLVNVLATGIMLGKDSHVLVAVLVCVGVGLGVGIINGLVTSAFNITPLIVTLGTATALTGVGMLYTGGAPRGGVPDSLAVWGQGTLATIPVPTIIWILATLLMAVVLSRTRYARNLYATGANVRAAIGAAIPVQWVTVSAYALSGLFSAVAGLLLTAYIGIPSVGIGSTYMLEAIAAVVVGGTPLSGGKGGVVSTAGGVLFLTILGSLTTILNLPIGFQDVIEGVILALGLALYARMEGGRRS